MIVRYLFSFLLGMAGMLQAGAQCSTTITSFPYREDFESSDGQWYSGGVLPDWQWGVPAKPVISSAGSGNKCWVVGGLTGNRYNDNEASWLQARPCFSFLNIQHPYVSFRVFWETEQRYDGAAFQYSTDGGSVWKTIGAPGDIPDCLNANWYNASQVNYLQATPFLNSNGSGWSGNIQATSGSCQGGNGSGKWVTASRTMPYLAGEVSVKFRFIFASGTICNSFDGFAIDDIYIGEAPPNDANFSFSCSGKNSVSFQNTSALCPTTFSWDFDDPASGTSNNSSLVNTVHNFSGPGIYNVRLTVSGPDNLPSTITKAVTLLGLQAGPVVPADCETNTGGSATIQVPGGGLYTYVWNTNPPQTGPTATNLGTGTYQVTVSGTDECPADTSLNIPLALDCVGVYFPTAFTPNGDGRNDWFGPVGGIGAMTGYTMAVYNRWGEKVFQTTDPFIKWDGRVGGKRTDENLFIWFAEYRVPGEPVQFRKGTVMLIR